jgi:hypothetical protein
MEQQSEKLHEINGDNPNGSADLLSLPVNGGRTSVQTDTPLTQADSRDVRRSIRALRKKHGADTPIGRGCSNIDEMLQNGVSPAQIEWQIDRLRRLLEA